MTFSELSAPQRAAPAKVVKMSAREHKGGTVSMRLAVPVAVLEAIGTPKDRYTISVGQGPDTGWIRLAKFHKGSFQPRVHDPHKTGGSAIFYLGVTEFAPDQSQKGTECRWEPAGVAAMKIRMPRWCFVADEDKQAA